MMSRPAARSAERRDRAVARQSAMPVGQHWMWRIMGRLSLAALLSVSIVAACGCVQRRMTIRSDPPGALVYIDDHEIGMTPISTPFTYYGKRKIRLVKDRYQTLTVTQNVPPPWYQVFPLDFICENLIPGEIRDHRTFDYQLAPQMVTPPEQLLDRAEALRRGMHLSTGTAPSAFAPPGTANPAGIANPPGTNLSPAEGNPPAAAYSSGGGNPLGAGNPAAAGNPPPQPAAASNSALQPSTSPPLDGPPAVMPHPMAPSSTSVPTTPPPSMALPSLAP